MSRPLLAAALLLSASPARGWVRSSGDAGLCLWWSTREVHYAVHDPESDPASPVCASSPAGQALASARWSFDTWGQATLTGGAGPCTDLQLVYDGAAASTGTGLDCQNLVVFRRGPCDGLVPPGDPCRLWSVNGGATVNCADKYDCWDTDDPSHADSRIIALTTVSYVAGTGEIVDADMELNGWSGSGPAPPGYWFTCVDPPAPTCGPQPGELGCIAMDVQNVVTHEAGHVLGLGHSSVAGSTMQATAPAGETAKRTLAQDDVQGICAIYPAGQPTNTGPQPGFCNGSGQAAPRASSACTQPSGCGCGTAGSDGWLWLAALSLWRLLIPRPSPPSPPAPRGYRLQR